MAVEQRAEGVAPSALNLEDQFAIGWACQRQPPGSMKPARVGFILLWQGRHVKRLQPISPDLFPKRKGEEDSESLAGSRGQAQFQRSQAEAFIQTSD